MTKQAGGGFADVTTDEIDRYLTDVRKLVTGAEWGRLDRDEFARQAATVFAYLNTGGSALSCRELFPVA